MAIIEVTYCFTGEHGTFMKQKDQYEVTLCVLGEIINGFTGNIDSKFMEMKIKEICSVFENCLIDDVCGRATNENIAMYIFSKSFPYITMVKVRMGNITVTVGRKDYERIPYESYLKLQYGITQFLKGNLDKAIDFFSESISIYSENPQAYNLRGRAYRYKEQYKKAETDFDEVIVLAPGWSEGWRNKGNSLLFQKKYDDMIPYFEKAVVLNPRSALATNNLGYALGLCNRASEGLMCCKKAIELNPNYKEAYFDCALLLSKLGDYVQSNKYIELGQKVESLDKCIYKLGDEEYEKYIDCCTSL